MRRLSLAGLLCLLASGPTPADVPLQALIDVAPPGSILRLEARDYPDYPGPLRIVGCMEPMQQW